MGMNPSRETRLSPTLDGVVLPDGIGNGQRPVVVSPVEADGRSILSSRAIRLHDDNLSGSDAYDDNDCG